MRAPGEIFKLKRSLLLGTIVTLVSATMSCADPIEFTLSAGAISEDFIGRSEQYSTLGFNGVALTGSANYGRLSASATVGQSQHGEFNTLSNYDLSLALRNGDWQIGVGKIDRHWSPSRHTSLILSRNAPAFHSAYIRKSNPSTTDLPIIRWLGDWDGEFFLGTTEDANQPDNALLFGMRARIRPMKNLEIDFARSAQWGGSGQPQDLDTFLRILAGRTNVGPAASANQMAGVGISYTLPYVADGVRVYYQGIGEDEAAYLPSCFMHLGGLEVKTHALGVPTQLTIEYVDTRIKPTTGGFCGANTAYNPNASYTFAHKGKVIGAAIDTESVATTLHVKHQLPEMSINWSLGHYVINDQSLTTHRLSTTRAEGFVATAGLSRDILGGTLSALVAHQDFDLNTAGFGNGTRVGLSFEKTF